MSKLQNMRAIEIKNFRAVSSGWKTNAELWGDDGFQSAWVNQNQHLLGLR